MPEKIDILVCDDDKAYLNLMRIKLTRKGFSVRTSMSTKSVLEEIKTPPGLILLDISFPSRYEGLELLEKIKMDFPRLPVFMISSYGDPKTVVRAIRMGASEYFHK